MADPASYRPAPGSIPDSPGVYRFRDDHNRVIYVGKAKSLRSRLGSYFQDIAALHPRTQTMVRTASSVDWTVVGTEVEALQLEYSWIKEFDPRFNVRYRDDKSYPWLAVTLDEEYPRAQVMRGAKRRGVKYFGPYSHAWAIRDTLDALLRVFPMRTCSAGVFKRAGQVGRPCLLGYIGKCSAPCVGRVSAEEHRAIAEDFIDFMSGQTQKFVRRLEKEMRAASADQEYERAARLRDDIGALNRAMEKQAVVLGDGTDADVVAFAQDELEAAVQVFYVRGGRVRGQRGWVVDKVDNIGTPGLVEQFLTQAYLDSGTSDSEVPKEVLVPALPDDVDVVTELLELARGGKVALRVPQRGDKRALLETVERNAKEAFTRHKLKRSSDLTARALALQELQDALGLDQAPLRIECYDVSNLQGSDIVASMVVFEDGLARKSEYRRFAIRNVGQDDVSSIREVITRRFRRYLEERIDLTQVEMNPAEIAAAPADTDEDGELGHAVGSPVDPETGKPRKFAYPPQLVVVDGGAPQVAAAAEAMAALGIDDVSL
ncbi:MAG TPA: excinuclease ABC subunit UvrC, partial [Mycobacteriales bacterium]|nr:excinuclease ABC subunit UvrC [Mycobacteriales bacterium]